MRKLRKSKRSLSSIEAYACNCSTPCAAETCRCPCNLLVDNANAVTHAVADPIAENRNSNANTQNNYRK